jgi:ATP-dependent helicase HrpB
LPDAPPDAVAQAMLDGVRDLGLTISEGARLFLARARLAGNDANLPDHTEAHLMETLEDWLLPHLTGIRDAAQWRRFDILPALKARLDWDQQQRLDRLAPAQFTTPLGRRIPIDYASDPPEISLRIQELFGQTSHPSVGATPLKVTLLSPAGRPIQTTADIPGFWSGSYADVRKDMRAKYPRHPWPEDPTQADPTLRAKPRGT